MAQITTGERETEEVGGEGERERETEREREREATNGEEQGIKGGGAEFMLVSSPTPSTWFF